MTAESGVKVTDAVARMPACRRHLIADQLIETLIAVPLFASDNNAMFHADPHAGNLLYDERKGEVVILDWALTEQLTYNQRRHLALVFIMIALRDVTGVCNAIQALFEVGFGVDGRRERIVSDRVTQFIDQLPFTRLPEAIDAIRLVDLVALEGVPFPAPLLMFRKVLFTLDGIVHEIAGPSTSIEFTLTRYVMQRWMANWVTFGSPLFPTDWLAVQSSVLLYGSRLWTQWARVLSSSLYSGAYAPGAAPDQTATTDEVG
jgi:ubiquinone biosynthesis protein